MTFYAKDVLYSYVGNIFPTECLVFICWEYLLEAIGGSLNDSNSSFYLFLCVICVHISRCAVYLHICSYLKLIIICLLKIVGRSLTWIMEFMMGKEHP